MALINLRNALMGGRRLPYDAEVEYLESTGTQWIDTGRPVPADFWFDATIDVTGTDGAYKTLLGARISSGNQDYQFSFQGAGNSFLARYGTSKSQYFSSLQTGLTRIRVESGGNLYINESFVRQLGVDSPSTLNMYIFALNNNGVASQQAEYIRLYSLKYGGTNENHDFIPVRKGAVGYLYDRVSGKLFGNAGTGAFVLGQDVVPVEYIESHGTEWIDTGAKKTSGTTVDCTFSLSATNSKAIFGARTSATDLDRLMLMAIGSYFRFDARFQPQIGTPDTTSTFRFQYDGTDATLTNLTTGTTSTSSTPIGDAATLDISLFGVNTNGIVGSLMLGRMYAFKIWDSGTPLRSFLPVRVGTEGAAMDVLTRRIYRNVGTGAFAYGNDLKYPIPAA